MQKFHDGQKAAKISTILSNLFNLDKAAVRGIFEVVEFESVVKIEPALFLAATGLHFCTKFGLN